MRPRCCIHCDGSFWNYPEVCKPKHLMIARMINKCPEFYPGIDRNDVLHEQYDSFMKEYKLEIENEPT